MGQRFARICGIAIVLAILVQLSERAGEARQIGEVSGKSWAFGVISLLFGVRALASEASGTVSVQQRDLLWGIAGGGVLAIIIRTFA